MNSSTFSSEDRWAPASATPKAAILAIALVVCYEAGFFACTDPLTGAPVFEPTADDATVSSKHQMLESRSSARIVAVGDSSCLMGVIPEIVTQETGLDTTNLGTLSSLTVAGFCSMGEEAIAKAPRPAAVIVVTLPRAFEVTLAKARGFDQVGRYSIAYRQELDGYDVTFTDAASWFFKKHRMNRFPPQFGGSFAEFQQRLENRGGFWPETGSYEFKGEVRTQFRASPWAVDQLKHLIQKAELRGVDVLLWLSPRPTDYCTADYLRQAHESLTPLEIEFENFTMLQDHVPHWSPARFGSEAHLTEEQAGVNSQNLGLAIRKYLDMRNVGE